MNNVKINNELNLAYPESFNEMGEEELSRYFGSPDNRWGAYDAERHIILSVAWAKRGFFGMLTDTESFLYGLESRMRRNLVNYQQICRIKTKLGKIQAHGVRFEYRVNDACRVHVADLVAFRYKKRYYAIYFVSRKTNAASSRLEFSEILKSVTFE